MKVPKKLLVAMERYINDSLLPVCYDLQKQYDPGTSFEDYCNLVLEGLKEGGKK